MWYDQSIMADTSVGRAKEQMSQDIRSFKALRQ